MSNRVKIKIPRELAEKLDGESLDSLQKYVSELLAIDLYIREKISFGRAAELARLSYDAFWDTLRKRGFKLRSGPKTLEEAKAEYSKAKRYVKATVKVDDRGRITLPKQLREELQLHPGEELVIREEKGVIHISRQFQPPKRFTVNENGGKKRFLTQERRPLVKKRILLDVNAVAIYLVEDHPGHTFIVNEIDPG